MKASVTYSNKIIKYMDEIELLVGFRFCDKFPEIYSLYKKRLKLDDWKGLYKLSEVLEKLYISFDCDDDL